ncbi:MAG: TIGR00730 family Rossman fold protein [Acidimicrobiia bacterium]
MAYDLGNPELDQAVADLVAAASENDNADLINEMITTVLKLHRDNGNRGDLKLINTALKEMRYSNLVFSRHDEPKVTIYGSARLVEDDPDYQITMRFGKTMAERGWGVITGAGPGVMEAGNRGAGIENSYGVNIRLPFEASSNKYIDPERNVNFKYFFTRKLGFVKESHAFVILPGGFGTLDEAFELLTLVQTGKSDLHPIVLLESGKKNYWKPILDFARSVQVAEKLISESDLSLLHHTTSHEDAASHIEHFYANYHSQRYHSGKLILRIHTLPDPETLEQLNHDFSDIIVDGEMEIIGPTEAEIADNDALDCERITFLFDRRHFGRLRQLIDKLNDLVADAKVTKPAPVFSEEHAERPW